MSRPNLPSRPRIISSNAHKFVGRNVTVIGEVTSMTPHANTITIRLPDDGNIVVLLQKNNTTKIEPNLLTEVSGKLCSIGQLDAQWLKQFSPKQTKMFDNQLYKEAALIFDAHRNLYDI